MQIVLIIGVIIAAIVFSILGCVRLDALDEAAEKIEDPKLRVQNWKSTSVWLLWLLCAASLISLIWFFGSFGKLYNYEGGFTLHPAAEWQITEGQTEEAGQNFAYVRTDKDGESGILQLTVVTLSAKDAQVKGAEIKDTKGTRISELKEARSHLKPDAKAAEKQLKADAKVETKELKTTLKGQKAELKAALKINDEQLKINLENIKNKLKQDLADNSRKAREVWQKGWLSQEGDGAEDAHFTALKNNRLYTVYVSSVSGELSRLSIKPVGFFRGLFDGCVLPGSALIAIFLDAIHPYKTINNGFSYLLGFIIGFLILIAFTSWLVYIILMKIGREKWKQKWIVMSEEEKHTYRTQLWRDEMDLIIFGYEKYDQPYYARKVKGAEDKFDETEEDFDMMTPEEVLDQFKLSMESDGGIGSWFKKTFTSGTAFKEAQERFEELKSIYDYYQMRYDISDAKKDAANAEYNYIREKAVLYAVQLKEIKKNLSVKQREIIDKSNALDVNHDVLNLQELNSILDSIDRFNAEYTIQASESLKETMDFANTAFEESGKLLSSSFEKNKNKKGEGDFDMALGAVSAGLGLVAIAGEGISQIVGNIQKNQEGIKRLKEAELEIIDAIEGIESNQFKVDTFTTRLG
ncbi:MAG: hypothetical protein LBT13_11435 [Treponema sp.]|jgi:hypothetical protein|nr:hypothetical protein [Treponema sp.]